MPAPYECDHSDDAEQFAEVIVETPLGTRRILWESLRARNYPLTQRGALRLALDLEADEMA